MVDSQGVPDELVEAILVHTDWRTIIRCLQVSKQFYGVITHSRPLEYRLELSVDNLEDGTPGAFSTLERLQTIRDRRLAWQTLEFNFKRIIEVPLQSLHQYSGSHFSYLTFERILNVLRIPSKLKGIPEKTFSLSLAHIAGPGEVFDMLIEPERDLLVLFIISGPMSAFIRCLSLSTGDRHPEVQMETMEFLGGSFSQLTKLEHVNETHLILTGMEPRGYHKLTVICWTSSKQELEFRSSVCITATFLNKQYLLLVRDPPGGPLTISILDIDRIQSTQVRYFDLDARQEPDALRVCQLFLPAKQKRYSAFALQFQRHNSPLRNTLDKPAPYWSGDDRLIAMSAQYGFAGVLEVNSDSEEDSAGGAQEEEFTLPVPFSTYARCIEACGTLAWEQWSSYGVHLLRSGNRFAGILAHYEVEGMVAVRCDVQNTNRILHRAPYDYSQPSVERELANSASPIHQDPAGLVPRGSPYGPSRIFRHDVVATTLLARVYRTQMEFQPGRTLANFRGLRIGEYSTCMKYHTMIQPGEFEPHVECHITSF